MRKLSRTGVIAVTAVAVTSVGIAFAAWTANGTGTGSAAADKAQPVGVTAAAAPAALLFPGKTVDLTATLTNPNPYPVKVVVSEVADSITSGDEDCDAADSVSAAIATTAHEIGANGSLPAAAIGTLAMNNDSVNECFNKTFTVDLTTVATSNAS